MNNAIKELIGDYQLFFSDLLSRLENIGITIKNMPISHLSYRVETMDEYTKLREQLKNFCSEFVETQFNGRAVSIHVLEEPLDLSNGFTTSVIELLAPRLVHMYPRGLESVGIILGKKLPGFVKKYLTVLTGVKDHGVHCQPAFVTFENEKTAKFYDISLEQIIYLQGWRLEKLFLNKNPA